MHPSVSQHGRVRIYFGREQVLDKYRERIDLLPTSKKMASNTYEPAMDTAYTVWASMLGRHRVLEG